MRNAALTFVYNEIINLPIWMDYYGRLFGKENLFIIDQSSSDGSTSSLEKVNIVRIPRVEFDEDAKTHQLSCMHSMLTSSYDVVIATDCDEILVPDPAKYADLNDYITRFDKDYINGVGIDLVHIITEESSIDLKQSILSQRRFGRFQAPECKQLLSRIPMHWLPGLHSSDKPPSFDPDLYIFHLKLMDYGIAMKRHEINRLTTWSAASLEREYGAHHRYSLKQFVHQNFLVPLDLLTRLDSDNFDFSPELEQMQANAFRDPEGFYRLPMDLSRIAKIPVRFSAAF